jgi:hypothetical protein
LGRAGFGASSACAKTNASVRMAIMLRILARERRPYNTFWYSISFSSLSHFPTPTAISDSISTFRPAFLSEISSRLWAPMENPYPSKSASRSSADAHRPDRFPTSGSGSATLPASRICTAFPHFLRPYCSCWYLSVF